MDGFIRAGGIDTYYESVSKGPPLFFLHGGFGCGADYPDQRDGLSHTHRVILLERRGHGHTADGEAPISYDLMAADAVAFMDAVGLDRAHVVGHSDGANTGMPLAMHHPERVNKLVLISGNFNVGGLRADALSRIAESPDADWTDELAWRRRLTPDPLEHWPVFLAKMRHVWMTEPALTESDLALVTAPTLVMGADGDVDTLEHFVAEFLAIRVPSCRSFPVPATSSFTNSPSSGTRPSCGSGQLA